jgi:hypothetical protein
MATRWFLSIDLMNADIVDAHVEMVDTLQVEDAGL